MKKDEMFFDWLELTAKLIQKYNLDILSVKIEGKYTINKENEINSKSYVKLNIKDGSKYIIKNEYYDILKTNEDKENQ